MATDMVVTTQSAPDAHTPEPGVDSGWGAAAEVDAAAAPHGQTAPGGEAGRGDEAGSGPRRGPGRVWRGVRLAPRVGAVGYLAGCLTLAVLAVAPTLIGWKPSVVLTGSMAPAVRPGDVVYFERVNPRLVEPGRIVLVDNPARPGRLLTHRLVRYNDDGLLVTKGDANRSVDSMSVRPEAVHGVARLVVPYVGRVALWGRGGGRELPLWAAVTAAACWLAVPGRARTRTVRAKPARRAGRRRWAWQRSPASQRNPE